MLQCCSPSEWATVTRQEEVDGELRLELRLDGGRVVTGAIRCALLRGEPATIRPGMRLKVYPR